MNNKQITACTERLRSIDGDAAAYFERLMLEANNAAGRAWQLRRMAWDQYHQYFEPRRKR